MTNCVTRVTDCVEELLIVSIDTDDARAGWPAHRRCIGPAHRRRIESERAQEVQEILLGVISSIGKGIEVGNHLVGFRSSAGMRGDRLEQIPGAAVMQEEDALADAPQRSGTELLATSVALRNTVRQSG